MDRAHHLEKVGRHYRVSVCQLVGVDWIGRYRGSAIRTTFPKLCEDLVNAIVQHSPASKILFNSNPADAFETAQRLFPDI